MRIFLILFISILATAAGTAPLSAQDQAISLSGSVMHETVSLDASGKEVTELVEPNTIVPGDRLIFGTDYNNGSDEAVDNFVVTNPLPPAVRLAPDADTTLIVSVDGGCPGVQNIADGVIGATSQQYPLLMASLGIEAIKKWADEGVKPEPTEGKDFFDTGVALVTDEPVEGVDSISVKEGLDLCWG